MLYYFITSVLVIIVLLIFTPLYLYLKDNKYPNYLTLFVKGSTTCVAVLICSIGMIILSASKSSTEIPSEIKNNWWIFIGLSICVIADIALEIHFPVGGVLFFFGHIGYLIFSLSLASFTPSSIPIYVVLLVLGLCYFYRYFSFLGRKKYAICIYASTIAASFSIGIVLPFTFGIYGLFPALGSCLLLISDVLLARNLLNKSTILSRIVALNFYYCGQLSMAMSIYIPAILTKI